MPRQSALAGHIVPIIESFILSKDDLHAIVQHVSAILSLVDLAVLFAFGWLLVPYVRIIYSVLYAGNSKKHLKKKEDENKDEEEEEEEEGENSFERSYVFLVSDHLSQIARLALLVYACDCVVR